MLQRPPTQGSVPPRRARALTRLLMAPLLLAPLLAVALPEAAGLRPAQAQANTGRSAPPQRRVGVWLTNSPSPLYYRADRIEKAVAELHQAGFTTLYPNVWSRGTTFHRSRWAPLEPALAQADAGLDPICRLTRAAQRRGLEVIPWFEYGLMEPADAAIVREQPEWVLQKQDGSTAYPLHGRTMVWLNPAHPGVRERFIGLILEIVQRCGVDGIQLDDHFAWPVELGYDATSRRLYREATGQEPPSDIHDRFWMRWRRQQLTDLLRQLRAALRQLDDQRGRAAISQGQPRPPATLVSLSPGPFRFAYNRWLQDWELWSVGGLVDELIIQNYAYSVKGFAKDLDQPALVKASGWGIPVEIGILAGFGGRTTDMVTLAEKARLAASRGHGVIYFYWEGLWGLHAGREGGSYRQSAFRQLHRELERLPLPPPTPQR